MNAIQLFDKIKGDFENYYFMKYEEFEVEIHRIQYPALVVAPVVVKETKLSAHRINLTETAVVMHLDYLPDLDNTTLAEYELISSLESKLIAALNKINSDLVAAENISELCKFSDSLCCGAFAVKFENLPTKC